MKLIAKASRYIVYDSCGYKVKSFDSFIAAANYKYTFGNTLWKIERK